MFLLYHATSFNWMPNVNKITSAPNQASCRSQRAGVADTIMAASEGALQESQAALDLRREPRTTTTSSNSELLSNPRGKQRSCSDTASHFQM